LIRHSQRYQSNTQTNMIITLTLILSFLVALNFILLIFSCNKTSEKIEQKKPRVIINEGPILAPTQYQTNQLAPTGS
jgi:hypothetical protein